VAPFELLPFARGLSTRAPTAFEASPSHAYVGTYEGALLVFAYSIDHEGLFTCKLERQLAVCQEAPVERVEVVAAFSAVLVQGGGQLHVVHAPSLQVRARIPADTAAAAGATEATLHALGELMGMAGDRGRVLSFCVGPGADRFRVCCQLRGALHFYDLSGARGASGLAPYASRPLADAHQGPLMAWPGRRLFIAGPHGYSVHEAPAAPSAATPQQPQSLFSLDGGRPAMLALPSEVLLVAGIVGVFVDHTGVTTRSSIAWAKPPRALAYCKPFIVALQEDQIEVHNAFDQRLVQRLPCTQRYHTMARSGELPLLAAHNVLYALRPVPLEAQLEPLLAEGRIEDAVVMASTAWNDSEAVARLQRFYGRAGAAALAQGRWDLAVPMLSNSSASPAALLSLFPSLLPVHLVPPDADADQGGGRGALGAPLSAAAAGEREAQAALAQVLERRRSARAPPAERRLVNTALAALYVSLGRAAPLAALLADGAADVEWLAGHAHAARAHACRLAVLRAAGRHREALELLQEIGTGATIASDVDAVEAALEVLAEAEDARLAFEHGRWLLVQDPARGLAAFTSARAAALDAEEVLEYLQHYGAGATLAFLEHLVYGRGVEEEALHTRLGALCIDLLQAAPPPQADDAGRRRGRGRQRQPGQDRAQAALLAQAQASLVRLLRHSRRYNAAALLGRVRAEAALYEAVVLLHSRLGQHPEALHILVHKARDFEAADAYCAEHCGSYAGEENLFFRLLKIYLAMPDAAEPGQVPENAFRLLNSRAHALDPLRVLPLLPGTTPVARIEEYLRRAYQQTISERRMKMVEKNLCRMEQLHVRLRLQEAHKNFVVVEEQMACDVCRKPLDRHVFGVYPNGVTAHFKCITDRHVCPVTGRNFAERPVLLLN